jgi:amidase
MNGYSACLALLLSISLLACSKQEEAPKPYAVEEVPLSQVSADLASGATTSVAVTEAYIARMKEYDSALNAVILIAPDALQQAAASDARRKAGKAIGPLDGVPILVKDNLDAVGMPTTAGSFALEANVPAQDSEVVKRLRGAGAIILGKVNTSQFAGFRNTKAFNGSTVGKGPHNPYDLMRTAGGSSSGSGIAATVSFAAGTIGTETSGSITSPSSLNGIVGLKPTIALVSRRGIVPISLTQDIAGPMTRTVRDAAMLLTVIAGTDPADRWSVEADAHKTDYVRVLDADALRGKRLGVVRGLRGYNERTQPALDEALGVLTAQGAELVEVSNDAFVDVSPEMRVILLHDFKEDLNAYLAGTPSEVKVRTLTDLIAFSKSDPRESMHTMDLFEDADATTGGRQNPEYVKNLEYAKRTTQAEGIDRMLQANNVVALVTITGNTAQPIPADGSASGHPVALVPKGQTTPSITTYAAVAGYPHLTVPMGQVNGLPVGLSFVGTAWTEALLMSLGYAYEQASHKRVPPTAYKAGAAQK